MYFIPIGMLLHSSAGVDTSASITYRGFLVNNLLPVTLGNIDAGPLMVGIV